MQGELLCRLGTRSHDEHGVIPRHASEDRDPTQRVDIGGNGVGTNARIWIKSNSAASVYTHYYDVNAATPVAKKNTSTKYEF